jgi:hypothetical protein
MPVAIHQFFVLTPAFIAMDMVQHCQTIMFLERQFGNSALFTFLFGWYASDVNLPPIGIIFAHLVCPAE